jgi:ketosteroid isomerase-like protein
VTDGDGPQIKGPEGPVQELYRAFARRDLAAVAGSLTEDVVWVEAGTHPFAGSYLGRDAVVDHLAVLVRETRGSYDLSLVQVYVASEERLIVRHHEAALRRGRRLDHEACLRVDVRSDGIHRVERFDAEVTQRHRFLA